MGWTIRRAVDADAERIGEITVAGWRHAYRGIVDDERLDALDAGEIAEVRRGAIAAPEPMAVFVADDERGRVMGYCVVGPPREPEPSDDGTAVLYTLYLDPAVIGTGAGSALHDAGVAHLAAAGFSRATLWVYTANTGAQRFYARRGWHADGEPYQGPGWSAPATPWARPL
ncbi:L-amino acid N-acyltransferase YncA [Actinomycetospora succinea]|uniref:L-amino acid N-acyltransferase YncA n=1 Tax=Actinomycetospora succinea TaxID=663603 RepID=A0A4R6UX42_9PSEU|nr:GNAT family N-acetyltransferase [Actinomycetospora succinea]TDQ51781.1 L-amino acid N-acyltransferase YncA [Actinomycetospora succinea]